MSGGAGTLYVAATPIGNLDDATPRLRSVLADVDIVAAEDTRHSQRLLAHFGLNTTLMALHEHNERDVVAPLIDSLLGGKDVALISDAGTPAVSDPGFRLVRAAHEAGVRVSPVPGPSAVISAVSVAGLPTDRFAFEGFLPSRRAARIEALRALRDERRTMVFFESVHRVAATLADCVDVFGADRPAAVGRELTKRFEQVRRDTLGGLAAAMAGGDIPERGEFVLLIGGAVSDERQLPREAEYLLNALLEAGLPVSRAAAIAAATFGASRNAMYARALELKSAAGD